MAEPVKAEPGWGCYATLIVAAALAVFFFVSCGRIMWRLGTPDQQQEATK